MFPVAFPVSFLFLVWSTSAEPQQQAPIVDTNSGRISGRTVLGPSGKAVDVFLGIPFAEPPIGHLRFRPPLDVKPWDGVFNATTPSPTCYQKKLPLPDELFPGKYILPRTKMSEDCLKLNIWTPKKTKSEPSPVMVWLFGGGFSGGSISCTAYDGAVLSTEEDVIVVTINYRQASLGFLYLDHPDIPGNAGLYDQLMALQWIKKNIAAFGGDPENITLFGHSAGAASIGHHILSPLSKYLFKRAIMSSCSPTSEPLFSSKEKALERSMYLVHGLGCPHDRTNTSAMVQCLVNADPNDILASERVKGYGFIFTHTPIVDGRLIAEHPRVVLKRGNFPKMDILLGNLKDESAMFVTAYDPFAFPLTDKIQPLEKNDFIDSMKVLEIDQEMFTRQVAGFMYLENYKTYFNVIRKWTSDFTFSCTLREFAELFSGGKLYKYVIPYHLAKAVPIPSWMGNFHTEETLMIFGDPLRNRYLYDDKEVEFSRRIMRYWANFARTGDPNVSPVKDESAIFWPRFTSDGKEYLVLSPNSTTVGHDFHKNFCIFWTQVRPALISLASTLRKKRH